MKKKAFLALILSGIMCFGLAACKSDSEDKENNNSADLSDSFYTEDLEKADYDGYNYRILIRRGKLPDQYVEELSDNVVHSAVYKRNQTVEAMYNVKITATESSNSGYDTDALNSILAGDDAYDAIFPHSRAAFSYAVQGAVENFNEISTIHLDKPWWSKDITQSANINGKLLVLDGDISTHRLDLASCLFFNKDIFDDLGIDYPYQTVKDGNWTFDEFERIVKLGAKDLNGDGTMDPENDQYGFWSSEWGAPITILYTGGQKIYTNNDEGIPELSLNSLKTVDIFDRFFALTDSDAAFLQMTEGNKNFEGNPDTGFKEGRAMIYDGTLGNAQNFRGMDNDIGILPFPKFSEDDEYATIVNGYAHLLIMPITVEDRERTGAITEALCAIGSRDVIPAFYDISLKTKSTRDNESEEMIDIISDSIVYDLGYVSGGTFQSIGRDLSKTSSHDFASTYASNESAALFKLAEFNEAYGGIER